MEPKKTGVLVLNQNYEPLNICNLKRAIVLLFKNKAEVIEYDSSKIRTVSQVFENPSVIKLRYFVKKPITKISLSRRNILIRDEYTCQYCGKNGVELTIDHVIPKRLGGKATWENLVSACKKCNNKKGDRTLQEAKIELIREVKPLKYLPNLHHSLKNFSLRKKEWEKYLL